MFYVITQRRLCLKDQSTEHVCAHECVDYTSRPRLGVITIDLQIRKLIFETSKKENQAMTKKVTIT